jgi:hypothetical protein
MQIWCLLAICNTGTRFQSADISELNLKNDGHKKIKRPELKRIWSWRSYNPENRFMRILYLINVIILLACLPSFGQKDWEDKFNGFVITENNVKVEGYITFEVGNLKQGTKIKLRKKPNDTPQIFYTLDLKGYAYKKDTFRIIHNLQPYLDDDKIIKKAEAKIISNGKLILYKIPQYEENYNTTRVTDPGMPGGSSTIMFKKLYNVYVIRDAKNEMIGIKKDNFQSIMHEMLTDAPDILIKIDNKTLKFKHLEKIVDEYNLRFH